MAQIDIQGEIEISKPAAEVFAYISDLNNDPKWRAEVVRMEFTGPFQIGRSNIEHSKFFGFFKLASPFDITECREGTYWAFKSPASSKSPLSGSREVIALDENTTRFIYNLSGDYGLPGFLSNGVRKIYQGWLDGYLLTLKENLEA